MAQVKRQNVHSGIAYPELRPVTERHFRRQPLHSRNRKHATRAEFVFHALINAALVFGLLQCVRTVVHGSFTLSQLLHSQAAVAQYHADTLRENRVLQNKIRLYSSPTGIEELARNYLNMVGKNELPVRFQ